jgi:hypothetical protein
MLAGRGELAAGAGSVLVDSAAVSALRLSSQGEAAVATAGEFKVGTAIAD